MNVEIEIIMLHLKKHLSNFLITFKHTVYNETPLYLLIHVHNSVIYFQFDYHDPH